MFIINLIKRPWGLKVQFSLGLKCFTFTKKQLPGVTSSCTTFLNFNLDVIKTITQRKDYYLQLAQNTLRGKPHITFFDTPLFLSCHRFGIAPSIYWLINSNYFNINDSLNYTLLGKKTEAIILVICQFVLKHSHIHTKKPLDNKMEWNGFDKSVHQQPQSI